MHDYQLNLNLGSSIPAKKVYGAVYGYFDFTPHFLLSREVNNNIKTPFQTRMHKRYFVRAVYMYKISNIKYFVDVLLCV